MSADRRLLPSLLDRLTDPTAAGYTDAQMRDAVKHDLGELLNAKLSDPAVARDCPHPPRPGEPRRPVCYGTGLPTGDVCGTCCPELKKSILAYGPPDLSIYDATNPAVCEQIGREIEAVIARHEPRLAGVRVTVPPQAFDAVHRELRFSVDAVLAVDPSNRLSFHTVLELITGKAVIDPPARKTA